MATTPQSQTSPIQYSTPNEPGPISAAPTIYYIYVVTQLTYEPNDSAHPTIQTCRAFERASQAIIHANALYHATHHRDYGVPEVEEVELWGSDAINNVYVLRSNRDNFTGKAEEYRPQEVRVSRVWLEVKGARLMTIAHRVARAEMFRARGRSSSVVESGPGRAVAGQSADIADQSPEVEHVEIASERSNGNEKEQVAESPERSHLKRSGPVNKRIEDLKGG